MKSPDHQAAFIALRQILERAAADFTVPADSGTRYCLDAKIGPATLSAWGGKVRRPSIPVAWVEAGKAYVSFHLMGLDGGARTAPAISAALAARMQGKTCFNFRAPEAELFAELELLTTRVLLGMRKAGFIAL